MDISPTDLLAEYRRASAQWPFIGDVEHADELPPMMLYAVGSRETNLTNEIGDSGHGHGVWQLDNRSHEIPAGFDQDVRQQAAVAGGMLRGLLFHYAGQPGQVRAALAAYNAGTGPVDYDLAHGLPVDSGTAHGDYSADVYARMVWLQRNTAASPTPEGQSPDMQMFLAKQPDSTIVWVVAASLASKAHVVDPASLSTLESSGVYKWLEPGLTAEQLANIPTVGGPK